MTARKSAAIPVRLLWAVFLVQAIVSPFVDLPYNYWLGWLPALAAVAIGGALSHGRQRRTAAEPPGHRSRSARP